MKRNNNTETNKKIAELEKEIDNLNTALGYSQNMTEIMSHNFDQESDGNTDIDRILKQNLMDFYKGMTKDLMEISDDNDESFDDEE